jgi:DNA-binding transcriptional LysR family regulator
MKPNAKARTPLFDLDLLKAIVMVADCGTFTAASARLHSTQSTVSQKVRRLEEMAGHKLLERGSRDVTPTDAGETLLAYARRMLALNDEMIEALSGATVGLTVRLGVPEDFVGVPTTHMLAAFNRKHPQVKRAAFNRNHGYRAASSPDGRCGRQGTRARVGTDVRAAAAIT